MKFTSTLIAGLSAATAVTATPWGNGWGYNPSPIPGYPHGNPWCLSDDQAYFLVNQFKTLLTSSNRGTSAQIGQTLLDDHFVETSDSINMLAGIPLGGPTFSGKQAYIAGVTAAPAIPSMNTLDVWHDCVHISWRWQAAQIGSNKYPVKGINDFTIGNPATGQIVASNMEFNSLAWGADIGWTVVPPSYGNSTGPH